MQQVYRFGPAPEQPARHLFVFLHASGADARSMIPAAFKYQGRFPSAALVVPSGFSLYQRTPESKQWFSTKNLSAENHMDRVSAILPRIEQLVRREQTNHRVRPEHTVLIGYSQGGTVALEAVKAMPELAGAVVAYAARFARLPRTGTRMDARIHLVHGEYDSVVSRVYAERAQRALSGLHVPVTLDIIEHLGHALTHEAICRGSLRLLQGIYERRRATLRSAAQGNPVVSSFLAFLHHVAAFAFVAALAIELVLIRDELTLKTARKLPLVDLAAGISAGVVLIVGAVRVMYFEKGADYYLHSAPFIAKLSLFVIIALLSIYPTIEFLTWLKPVGQGQLPVVSEQKRRLLRAIIHAELGLVVLLILCAALMARGVGYFG